MLHKRLEGLYLEKIKQRYDEIKPHVHSNVTPIEGVEVREVFGFEKIEDALKSPGFRPVKVGEMWGGEGKSGWFKIRFTLPESFKGKPAAAMIDIGFEGCVFIDGTPYCGVDKNHKEVLLSDKAEAGKSYELIVEAMSGPFWQDHWPEYVDPAKFKRADIVTINREVERYTYALGFLLQLAEALPEKSVRRAKLVYGLNKSVNVFDYDHTDEDSLRKSAQEAYKELQPLLDKKSEPSSVQLSCCGHGHIDTAWLWPYDEAIRKCARTFSTAVRYMEQYPEYVFSQSQPQLYEFTKQRYPKLYEEIKKWVKTGRWDVVGEMWVEADVNVSSGESLVRQIIFGKRFYAEEFGVEPRDTWLPDAFGYSAALPQILMKGGMRSFNTTKHLWTNQFDALPYSSCWWQGIDGTKILAHFPSCGTYTTQVTPKLLRKAQDDYLEKDRSEHVFYQFGWGDGGGGPDRTHLEHLRLAKDLEGLPRCVQRPAHEFFTDLMKEADSFPTWVGELNIELHRGTFTTQGRTKRNNRKAELALRDAEFLSTAAMTGGMAYPSDELEKAWKIVLKNQFHDVLPGSSVTLVYKETEEDYKNAFKLIEDAASKAVTNLTGKIDTQGVGECAVVFNTLPWDRDAIAAIPLKDTGSYSVLDRQGAPVPSQISADGKAIHISAHAPALGYSTYRVVKGTQETETKPLTVSTNLLENRFFKIKIDDQGLMTSIYDKTAGREVIPQGAKANMFQYFEDKPLCWDAWDVDFFFEEKGWDVTSLDSIEVSEVGPLYGSIRLTRSFSGSKIEQKIIIYADTPRIDFETRVDWHEERKLLKVAFPVEISSPMARYEIQFGNLERSTHRSTSWDFARFETFGHKWADLSEGGYGVSLMNDCKYGYDIHDNVMRLTLLRAPKDPDPLADQGENIFTYSLYPHQGDYACGGTVKAGYDLNVPMRAVVTPSHSGSLPATMSLFGVDSDHVVLETVKKSETDNSIILRFYEAHNKRGRVNVSTDLHIKAVHECDLLERKIGDVEIKEGVISFDILPFEIKTLKLVTD